MAEIKLIFKPDYSEVSKAIASIKNDISKSIGNVKITIDSSGAQSVQKMAAGLRDVATQAGRLDKEYGTLMRSTTTVDKATGDLIQKTREYQKTALTAFKTVEDAQGNVTESEIKNYKELDKIAQKQADDFVKLKRYVFEQYRKWDEEDAREAEAKRQKELEAERKATEEKNKLKLQMSRFNREQDEKDAAEAEKQAQRQAAAQKKAEDQVVSLRREYANFIRQIEILKAQYPEGTFDEIEKEALEAQRELQNLDNTSKTFVGDVDRLSSGLKKEKAQLAEVREETNKLDKVTESFWMNIQKFARWYIGGNIVTKVIGSLREALSTMKEVDTELANIQKVTDRTDQQMQKTAEAAYKVASAYGIAAQDYLESVAEFAKAGFGDMSEQLAEIATKTQLVGDVTSSIANKFLIASNAAWKMNGDIATLNKTLDAANIIENNYATSIEKLAAGMPIVSSIAAQAGMTFEETIAALGTITSVTQETGTKAATALRALILNILGAVGEYEDGIVVTEESVKSLDGILQVYAKDALAAAKAAGTVINPMEAIAALAKASEEGLVNQAELFEVLSGLGGKLRTNQLTALVQNFDMMQEMLDKTKNSAGSADREISVMLDTWEAKTNILKNTWTEFVASFIKTDAIKTALDGVIGLIEMLNTDLGRTAIIATAIPTVIMAIISALRPLYAAIMAHPILAAVSAVIAAIYAAEVAANKAARAVENIREAARDANSEYKNILSTIEELESRSENLTQLESKRLEILKREAIEAEKEAKQKALTAYYASYSGGMTGSGLNQHWVSYTAQEKSRDLIKTYMELQSRLNTAETTAEMAELESQMQDTMNAITAMADDLLALQDILGDDLPEAGKNAIEILTLFVSGLNKATEKEEETERKTKEVAETYKSLAQRLAEASDAATKYDTAIGKVVSAMGDFGKSSIEVYNAMVELESTIPGSTDKLYDFDTATLLTKEDVLGSKDALLDFIDTQKQLEFSSAISELEAVAAAYWDIAGAALAAMSNQQAQAQMSGVLAFTTGTGTSSAASETTARLADLKQQKAEWDAYVATLRARSSYKPDTSGRGSYTPVSSAPESTTDEELIKRQKIIELLKAELAFLKASGASTEDIVAKQKEIQAALHEEAEYLRGTQAYLDEDADTLVSVKNLSTEWWDIQAEIKKLTEKTEQATEDELNRLKAVVAYKKQELAFLQASGASEEAIAAKRKEIQAALHDQAEEMRRILAVMKEQGASEADITAYEREILALSTEWWDIQEEINKSLEKQKELQREMFDTLKKQVDEYYAKLIEDKEKELTLEERILAVQQAEAALANAQRERTVRYYNAATGQWEWQANAKNVKSAQDALKKAQDDLNKYQREQAWKEFKSAWEYVSEQIKAGAMTFQEAYDYMYREMKHIQDTYGVDLGGTLEDSIGGFKHLNYGIDGLTQEVANSLGASVAVLDERLKQYETAVGALKDAFDDASEKVKRGEMTMEDAYSYLRDRAKEIADKYGIDMTGALEEAIAGMDKTNMSIDDLWKSVILNLMKVNSARWFDANDEEKARLHAQNEYLGKLIGATYDPSGYWYLNGSKLYESQRGVDYSGKTSGWGNYTGSGSGYSSGGSSSGGSAGGGGSSGRGSSSYTGSNEVIKSNGKFYDSYGRAYSTLEEAIAGNAAGTGGTDGKPMTNGTGFLAAAGRTGKITYGSVFGNRVTDAEGNTHWLDPDHQYFKSSNGYIYDATEATDLELARHGLYRTELGGKTVAMPIPDNLAAGFALNWSKLEADHIQKTGSLPLTPDELYGPDDNDTHGAPASAVLGSTQSSYKSSNGSSSWDSMMTLGEDDISRSGGGYSNDTPSAPASSGAVNYVTVNTTGDTYIIDGVRIGEEQARSTTIYDLARLAGDLGQYKGAV